MYFQGVETRALSTRGVKLMCSTCTALTELPLEGLHLLLQALLVTLGHLEFLLGLLEGGRHALQSRGG